MTVHHKKGGIGTVGYLPCFPDGASAVEGGGGGARLLRLVWRVHHALTIVLIRHRRRQGHAIIVRYLKQKIQFIITEGYVL